MSTLRLYVHNLLTMPIFRELSWYAVSQVVVQLVSFFSVIVVSRYLGPTNLGLYSFVQNYAGAFLTVIGGMDFYFTWKIAKSENYHQDVQNYIGHKFHTYVTLSVVGIVSAWLIMPHDVSLMVTIFLSPVFLQSLNAFSFYGVVTNRAKLMSVITVVCSILLLLVKLSLVYFHASLYYFVAVAALDMVIPGIILVTYFLRFKEWQHSLFMLRFPSFLSSVQFLYSIRVSILALISWQLLLRADQLILATFSNAYTLGIYAAAVKIAEVPNFLAGVLSTALISRIAHISGKQDDFSQGRMKTIMLSYFTVGSVIAVGIIVLAPFIVHFLYGARFTGSVPVLRAYALSIPGMFMNYFFLGAYGVRDRHHHQVMIFGISLLTNIVLVYALTPIFGLVGAAIATTIAYTISALGFYFNLERV